MTLPKPKGNGLRKPPIKNAFAEHPVAWPNATVMLTTDWYLQCWYKQIFTLMPTTNSYTAAYTVAYHYVFLHCCLQSCLPLLPTTDGFTPNCVLIVIELPPSRMLWEASDVVSSMMSSARFPMFYVCFLLCSLQNLKSKKLLGWVWSTVLGVAPVANVESAQDAHRKSPNFVHVNSEFDMLPHSAASALGLPFILSIGFGKFRLHT
jgi:hypothetical protein